MHADDNIGENCHNVIHFGNHTVDHRTNNLFTRQPLAVARSLAQQQHSLKSLTYVTNYMSSAYITTGAPYDGAFKDFHQLEDVTLIGCCPAFERAVLSISPPPNLKHLTFQSERPFRNTAATPIYQAPNSLQFTLADIPFLRTPSVSLPPTLETLDIVYEHQFLTPFRSTTDLTIPGIAERFFIRKAVEEVEKMKTSVSEANSANGANGTHSASGANGLRLRVFEMSFESGNWYFPPFLYGEAEPVKNAVNVDGVFVGKYKLPEPTSLERQRTPRIIARELTLMGDW